MKAAKKALSDVLKKRVAATTQSLTWREELKRNGESTGGLLLLRCLLRSSGEDIKDGLERPIGSRWIHYAVPRAIHQLPQARVAPHPKRAEPLITLVRFALNTATVNRPVLPPLTDTLLFADKFRAAALAWHGHLKSCEHPRNLCGRERDNTGERRIEGHNHAFFWPTDEDNDGFIDHMSVYCSHNFLASEADALRRLLRIRQRGGRPDLLVTPVFLGDSADFGPWKRDATVFVSATPYYCPVNLSHGKNSGGKVRSIAKEILRSLRLTNVVQTEAEVVSIHEIVFNDAADVISATWTRADLSDARYRTAWLKPPDESFDPGTLAGLQLDGGTRLLRALAFCRRRRHHVIEAPGRMFRIEFATLRSWPVSADYGFRGDRATHPRRLRRVRPQPIKIMNDQDPSASSENRLSETESSPMPRGLSPGAGGARLGGEREAPQKTGEPKQVKIVLRIEAVESQLASVAQPAVETPAPALPQPPPSPSRHENEPQQIPARMLNEFVYCQRLFYYEFVEGVFVESVDTLRGEAIHKRVDSGNGALPAAKKKAKKTTQDEPAATVEAPTKEAETQNAEPETIHSRSVQMGSERLGVVAKMDLVESKTGERRFVHRVGSLPG
jgi:hypothetical protein